MKSLIPWRREKPEAVPTLSSGNWFERFWENPLKDYLSPFKELQSFRLPSIDISEDSNEVVIRAETPGMDEKEIDLTFQDGILRIHGEKKNRKEEKKNNSYYSECSYGYFSREIPLGKKINWEKSEARYKNGVLTVRMPKIESKAIQIKVN